MFGPIVYIKAFSNRFVVREIKRRRSHSLDAVVPFSTDRQLVGDFSSAEDTLKIALRAVIGRKWLLRPVAVIQPIDMTEGGPSQTEKMILHTLAVNAGARRAIVWYGEKLSDQDVILKAQQGNSADAV